MRRAGELWRRVRDGNPPDGGLEYDHAIPDQLHALCRLIGFADDVELEIQSVEQLYRLVKVFSWPDDELGEKAEVLGRISYVAWRHCRRLLGYDAAESWEGETARHVLADGATRDFFTIPPNRRSESLTRRFLSDPATLLTACVRLRHRINARPASVLAEASAIYRWLATQAPISLSSEELTYFLAELACLAAFGSMHCGHSAEGQTWADRVDRHCERVTNPDPLRARAEHARLAILYRLRRYGDVLERLPTLRQRFIDLGMRLLAAKASYLEAVALKDCGREDAAREAFEALSRNPVAQDEPLLYGLAILGIAEVDGHQGRYEAAMTRLEAARPVLEGAGVTYALAHLKGIEGEIQRDHGCLAKAVESYREAIAGYSTLRMASLAAYMRILRAETLMALGREDEAVSEIAAAIPVIEERHLMDEGIAAVALLLESIRRRRVDARALQRLRQQLDCTKRGGEL